MFPTTDLRLRTYAQMLLRHRLAIVLVVVVVLAIGVVPSLLEDEQYRVFRVVAHTDRGGLAIPGLQRPTQRADP